LEKQTLVHEAKLAIQDEFLKKEKAAHVQERIARSAEIQDCRTKTMRLRDSLLTNLKEEASSKCAVVAKGQQNYPQLVQKLVVQGLVKIEENEVVVYCRAQDAPTVAKILPLAVQEYVQLMARESGVTLKPQVTLNTDAKLQLPEDSFGGVLLTALNGKIKCDNTMKSRLGLVYEELLPSLRSIMFPDALSA
jgi:V-type H+-transporting ATPase subunit E